MAVGVSVVVGVGVEVCTILRLLVGSASTGLEHETIRKNIRRTGRKRFMFELTEQDVLLFFADRRCST